MSYVELRGSTYYALLVVPLDVRKIIGKSKFKQSLKTHNKKQAELLAAPFILKWKAQINHARGLGSEVVYEGLRWKNQFDYLKNNPHLDGFPPEIEDSYNSTVLKLHKKHGKEAVDLMSHVIDDTAIFSENFYYAWQSSLNHSIKTNERKSKDVRLFIEKFPVLNGVDYYVLRSWFRELEQDRSFTTLSRIKTNCYDFACYVKDESKLDLTPHFLNVLGSKTKVKQAKDSAESWIPFKPSDIVTLYTTCKNKDRRHYGVDYQLMDLISLAAYTGARLEEICNIRVDDVLIDHESKEYSIMITDSKTKAGIRNFPIHSALMPVVLRLIRDSSDGYLITNQKPNRYGERCHSLKNRFCRLKIGLGYSDLHVFHSIRKTFVTQLENARVLENVAADIVGHETRKITYSLYSSGVEYALKKEAVESVSYPFDFCFI